MPEQESHGHPSTNGNSPAGVSPSASYPRLGEEQIEPAQEQEPTPIYEIVIFCHAHNVNHLVQALEDESKHALEELPMEVLWSGESSVLHQGVIVLEWQGALNPAFLQSLSIDHEIFDYVVYGWSVDEPAGNEEQEKQAAQDQEESGTEGRQLE